jgi:hypothetical protein
MATSTLSSNETSQAPRLKLASPFLAGTKKILIDRTRYLLDFEAGTRPKVSSVRPFSRYRKRRYQAQ